jgi:hypothetical protein
METSAKTRIRCEDCFYELVREIRKSAEAELSLKSKRKKASRGTKCAVL